jgi:hypothetical protein
VCGNEISSVYIRVETTGIHDGLENLWHSLTIDCLIPWLPPSYPINVVVAVRVTIGGNGQSLHGNWEHVLILGMVDFERNEWHTVLPTCELPMPALSSGIHAFSFKSSLPMIIKSLSNRRSAARGLLACNKSFTNPIAASVSRGTIESPWQGIVEPAMRHHFAYRYGLNPCIRI